MRGYEVWRAKENDPPILVKSGSFPIPRYQDFDVAEGCLYTYAVRAKIKLLPLADAQKAVDCLVSVLKNEIILGFIIGHSSYPKQPHNMRDTTA